MIKFEKVKRFADVDINMPCRKTTDSAGYDMEVAETVVVPSIFKHWEKMKETYSAYNIARMSIDDMAKITKELKAKPTLVSTGMKCYLEPNTYLELTVRSSCPLKYWLMMGNSVGVIDADYADNLDNEGEIFFQFYNLSPFDIVLNKGDIIGQGIIKPFLTTDDDAANGKRVGGFGSTSNV